MERWRLMTWQLVEEVVEGARRGDGEMERSLRRDGEMERWKYGDGDRGWGEGELGTY
jgi:hypothetical protein